MGKKQIIPQECAPWYALTFLVNNLRFQSVIENGKLEVRKQFHGASRTA